MIIDGTITLGQLHDAVADVTRQLIGKGLDIRQVRDVPVFGIIEGDTCLLGEMKTDTAESLGHIATIEVTR